MEFRKYPSIENLSSGLYSKIIDYINNPELEWVVTEKVHGCNLSFYINRNEIKVGRRTGFIDIENENFYNVQSILEKYKQSFLNIQKYIDVEKKSYKTLSPFSNKTNTNIIIYGELYGGKYTHPNVKNDELSKRVQKEVEYSVHNDFICFDVKVDNEFLSFIDAKDYCRKFNIPFIRHEYIGDFKEAIEISNGCYINQTLIPKLHNLPPIRDNIREGNIIRPNESLKFTNGSRIIIKHKNERFYEKKRTKEPFEIKKIENELPTEFTDFITSSRFNSVVSKFGPILLERKNRGQLIKEYQNDVIEDYKKEYDNFDNLNKRRISRVIVTFINKELKNQ